MMTREELQQVREDARRQIEAYDCRILVCSGTGCIATGSTKIYEEFLELVKKGLQTGVTEEEMLSLVRKSCEEEQR